MNDRKNVIKIYGSALGYLGSYYESFSELNFSYGLSICRRLSEECLKIAKDEQLDGCRNKELVAIRLSATHDLLADLLP